MSRDYHVRVKGVDRYADLKLFGPGAIHLSV